MNLENIRRFSRAGVFLLLNKTESSFYINHTIDFKYFLGKSLEIMREARTSSEFELVELSTSSDIETLKLHTEYWIDQYLSNGFSEILPRGRKTVQYYVRVKASWDYKYYDVQLVTKRGSKALTVGRFLNWNEADQFRKECYGDNNPFRYPVYSTNSLTRELLSQTGERKIII